MTIEQLNLEVLGTEVSELDSQYQKYLNFFNQSLKQDKLTEAVREKFEFISNNDTSLNFRQRSLLNNRQIPKMLEYIK